jgi:hypothetical protein
MGENIPHIESSGSKGVHVVFRTAREEDARRRNAKRRNIVGWFEKGVPHDDIFGALWSIPRVAREVGNFGVTLTDLDSSFFSPLRIEKPNFQWDQISKSDLTSPDTDQTLCYVIMYIPS